MMLSVAITASVTGTWIAKHTVGENISTACNRWMSINRIIVVSFTHEARAGSTLDRQYYYFMKHSPESGFDRLTLSLKPCTIN
jgi:hypothetical protein